MTLTPARLYVDTCSGFDDGQILTRTVAQNEDRIDFSLSPFESIQKLRFEPANDYLVMDLVKIEIHRRDSRFEVSNYSSNAVFKEDGRLVFATETPQIVVHAFSTPIQRIVFWIKYKAIGKEAVRYILAKYEDVLSDHRKQILRYIKDIEKIEELKVKLRLVENEAVFLKEALNAERDVKDTLLGSSSWKLTAPVRKLSISVKRYSSHLKTIGYRLTRQYATVIKSGLFDEADYLKRNPDVRRLGIHPVAHYLLHGAGEGRAPHPLFDTAYYMRRNPEVAASGMNPLVHYVRRGAVQGKDPHPLFDTAYYMAHNPDAARSGMNPLHHFMKVGAGEVRAPHPLFDTAYYACRNPEVAASGMNPLVHYVKQGAVQGKNPHPLFDTAYYMAHNPDVIQTGMNPLHHFIKVGAGEGRAPHPLFDTTYYMRRNPEVAASGMNPLVHYLENGEKNGNNPHPLFDINFYLGCYPEVAESKMNPLVHYIVQGAVTGFNPNPLFDSLYYLRCNPDVAAAEVNPLAHYVQSGSREGRDPNSLFISSYYVDQNPDAKALDITLLEHYRFEGWRKGIAPSPLFDTKFYLEKYPDVARSGMDPLTHYLEFGVYEKRTPSVSLETFSQKPKISILMPVYNVEERFLAEMILSVRRQIYGNWELCLVNDRSDHIFIKNILKKHAGSNGNMKFKLLEKNSGISKALNEAAGLATGEYLALLGYDDFLTMDALYEAVNAINENDADIVYSDEGVIDIKGRYLDSIFKPDFSPDLLLSHNYIAHFLVFKKKLFDMVGGFESDYDGAQLYDMILKLTEKTQKIHHIPKLLYYRHESTPSTSLNQYADDSGKRALEAALSRRNIKGSVLKANQPFFYRVKRVIAGTPMVSIIIPFRDQPEFLKNCIQTIFSKTSYSDFEIIGINNGSRQAETVALMKELSHADPRVRFVDYPVSFNYSKINNYGVSLASGKIILLLNNDIEIINPDWLETLLEHGQREEVGAVGGKLYYSNQTIQHAGVIIGINGFAGHSHRHAAADAKGHGNRLNCVQNVSAVSGAMMMVRKRLYVESGGLDEDNLAVSLNDIDFCLQLRQKGFLNIFTPYCEAIHHESVSRGYEETPEKKMRFHKEIKYFQNKWNRVIIIGDPYYNPNLSLESENFSLRRKGQTLKFYP